MTFPWETLPTEGPARVELAVTAGPLPPAPLTTEETLVALQRDVAYMVTHTAVLVHSSQPALQMLVNTPRGQIVPRGECKFTDGSTFELQDIGMPQPGAPTRSIKELMAEIWSVAQALGLEYRS